jgi:glucokinase
MGPPQGDVALAVDIGGTKMAAALVDEQGRVTAPRRVPTASGTGEQLFESLVELVRSVRGVRGDGPVAVCGVGCGGPMEGDLVSPLNIAQWRRFPLKARLADALDLPVHVDNDAKALALGEGWLGAAAGRRDFIAMVVSTGVGGGIVVDGRLLDGALGNSGHIGHVIVVPGGQVCGCGARGCLEAEASGLHIAGYTGRPAAEAGPDVVDHVGTVVGRAVASVCNLLDLRLAVVAGSVALGFGAPFFAAAQAELDRCARLDFSRGAVIRPGGLGADGPLVGAAAVGWRGVGRQVLGRQVLGRPPA